MSYARCSIVLCAGTVLFVGCGGSSLSPVGSNANTLHPTLKGSQTFSFTGAEQTFTVPSGVKRVTVAASGAGGGTCVSYCKGYGTSGNGGWVKATMPVTSGETLYVFVGGDNGYNGGGTCSGNSCYETLNGGGASDVRQGGDGLQNRVIVAGGGGGAGYIPYYMGIGGDGGAGGGRAGTAGGTGTGYLGSGLGGGPGTQHAGGAGGAGGGYNVKPPRRCRDGCGSCDGHYGLPGALGAGGDGAAYCGGPGGGGGGGYYGGGGAGSGAYSYFGVSFQYGAGGGGGGGSSFVEKRAFDVKDKKGGAAPGNGQIIISW